jgi:hypothetical protein
VRSRRLLFFGLVVACTLVAVVAVGAAMRGTDPAASGSPGARDVLPEARAADRPVILARSLDPERPEARGQVTLSALDSTRRTLAPLRCDRVHFAGGRGLCLARGGGFAIGYRARVFGADLRVRHDLDLAGVPSRARVSPDGRYGSVTLFVTGHSYATSGAFSTRTTLIDLTAGTKVAELEQFAVTYGGRQVTAVDRNFWGVTFARESDRFYATMATGGKTYLIAGSIRNRSARVLHANVECPSLSPDGTRIAYKQRTGVGKRPWRLAMLDLTTMRETPLAEPRSVDDQVEWLDDDHVLYGIEDTVFMVPADGTGTPGRFMAGADSPAVVRW